ncbi:thiopeptide-type bacteriocin biosynthesis protein [Aliibacillus thermotolerans]|uniref:Thiopeptide-type bacteriocin biosynthesis protein n=1 Tax=Aliibacillus thermotolerans TaxID=1834418 RepID=A0ABW0U460_9BACI|nr:thiopeptide-type bacteriocin biosynthesis protein [Aliibacillus thermotolerans]MDA3130699.1 hypothetical protein [Aliibacillus thermotolerans]
MVWHSLHIFYHNQDKWDSLLLHIYRQLKYGFNKTPSFFFIRYWEGGPHIRLRIKNISDYEKDQLKNNIINFFHLHPSTVKIDKEHFYNQYKVLISSNEDLEWYPNNSVQEIPYIPEVERYNGNEMMALSELQFEYSSKYVLEFLQTTKPNLERKYNHSLYILSQIIRSMNLSLQHQIDFLRCYCIATLHSYAPNHVKDYLQLYMETYQKSRLNDAVKKYWSDNSNPIYKQYSIFTEEVNRCVINEDFNFNNINIQTIEKLDKRSLAVMQLYWSWIHMFLNRIGISPLMESELTFLLSHSLNELKGVEI